MDQTVECRLIDGTTMNVPVSDLTFRISVYGVVIKDAKVLLSPQWDGYDVPGGGIELGEKMHDAVVREVKEETGIDVQPLHVLLVQDDFFFHPNKKRAFQTLLVYFLCEMTGGEISDAGFSETEREYAQKARWVEIERIPKLTFYNPINNRKLIEEAVTLLADMQLQRNLAVM